MGSGGCGSGNCVLTRVTLVGVALDCVGALGDLEVGLGNDLVEGEGTAGEDLAGVAVARGLSIRKYWVHSSLNSTHQRMWPCCSLSRVAVHSVAPQWQTPLKEDMLISCM